MRILITTAGSKNCETTIQISAQICHVVRTAPTILTVVKGKPQQKKAEKILSRAILTMAENDIQAHTKIRFGQSASEVLAEAREGNYDMLVIGMSPYHRRLRYIPGSITKAVLAQSPCPVLVAKGKFAALNRLLVCDSGVASPFLLEYLTDRMSALLTKNPEVTILHVMSQMSAGPGVKGWELRASAKELIQAHTPEGDILNQDVKALEQSDIHARTKIRHGLVLDEILAEVQDGGYDMVVIGAHSGSGWQHLLLDNLTYKIIHHIDRPVLVLK
ncbi:MAG: universal stress protein [Anaerolineaceae bacterium]|nr:universal stress protein [Anaerolineaceae bacterium]